MPPDSFPLSVPSIAFSPPPQLDSHPRSPARRRPEPPPPRLAPPNAAAQRRPTVAATRSLCHRRSRYARARPCRSSAATTTRACCSPPPLATLRHRHVQSHRSRTSCHFPRSHSPLSAHKVFYSLPDRDGSLDKEGEGGCGREASPQADPCIEGGREGRDGGQGRRGAGVRPCSSVQYQGAARQRQRQRQRYGQGPRCQGHQSHD